MSLTGKRLILLIVLFISACFFISAQQSGRNISPSVQNADVLASGASAPDANDTDAQKPIAEDTAGKNQSASTATKSVDQKAPAKLKSLSVNSVTKTGPDVPLDSKSSASKSGLGVVNTSDRKHVVGVAVNEKNRGTGNNLARKSAGLNQKAGKANKRSNGLRTAKSHVQSHHRALTKSNKRKRTVVQTTRRKLAVKKRVERRRSIVYASPKSVAKRRHWHVNVASTTPKRVKIVSRKLKPLPAAKWISPAEFWRVWRKKSHTGQ
jgi:hypothetical protein